MVSRQLEPGFENRSRLKPAPSRASRKQHTAVLHFRTRRHLVVSISGRTAPEGQRGIRLLWLTAAPLNFGPQPPGEGTIIAARDGQMSNFYVACDLSAEYGRVMLGTLNQGALTVSEVRRFPILPITDKDSLQWNIPELYQQILDGLGAIGNYEESIEGVSCDSWAGDYLLFESDGSLITPAYHHADPRAREGMQKVLTKVPQEAIYQETGVWPMPSNTLSQLAAERHKRLNRAQYLLPVADAFNYLLSGVPRFEVSQASATQLYNPVTQAWSSRLFSSLDLPPKLFPPLVPAGTELGPLRPEIAKTTGLDDTQVIATCSHETAAALAGLPLNPGESWAFLRFGSWTVMGTELTEPIITDASRTLSFTNEIGYGGSVRFSKQTSGSGFSKSAAASGRKKTAR